MGDQGPPGNDGDPGEQGPQGEQGEQGDPYPQATADDLAAFIEYEGRGLTQGRCSAATTSEAPPQTNKHVLRMTRVRVDFK